MCRGGTASECETGCANTRHRAVCFLASFFDLSSPQAVEKGTADAMFRAPAREAGLAETVAVTLPNGQRRIQVNAPSDVGIDWIT